MRIVSLSRVMLLIILLALHANAVEHTFIREYQYRASDSDSKVSARQKALKQVQFLLIEELGSYIESYVNYGVVEEDNKISKDFFHREIKSLSAGIVSAKILEENWNGYEYYIKAQISADPDAIIRHINRTLSNKRNLAIVDSLRTLLQQTNEDLENRGAEVLKLSAQLEQQNQMLSMKKQELDKLEKELQDAQTTLERYKIQEKNTQTELKRIENLIKSASQTAFYNVRLGMLPEEVKRVCGDPRSTVGYGGSNIKYNYGDVWVVFENGIVSVMVIANVFKSYYDRDDYERHERAGIIK